MSKYLYTLIGFVKPEYNNQAAFDIQHPHGSYQHYLASLPTTPAADPSKFIVGNWYEDNKDIMFRCVEYDNCDCSRPSHCHGVKGIPFTEEVFTSKGLSEEDKHLQLLEDIRQALGVKYNGVILDMYDHYSIFQVSINAPTYEEVCSQLLRAKQRIRELEEGLSLNELVVLCDEQKSRIKELEEQLDFSRRTIREGDALIRTLKGRIGNI